MLSFKPCEQSCVHVYFPPNRALPSSPCIDVCSMPDLRHCNWTLLVIVKDQSSHFVYLNIFIKIANMWKFELRSIGRRILILRSPNQLCGKLLHSPCSWKLCYFRGSHFSQLFNLHYQQLSITRIPNKVVMLTIFLSNYQSCLVPSRLLQN